MGVARLGGRKPRYRADGSPGPNLLPARYAGAATSPVVVEIKEGGGEVPLELQR